MPDIFDYLTWRGDIPFDAVAINNVDSLILSRISYIPFEDIVPDIGGASLRLGDAISAFIARPDAVSRVVMAADMTLCAELVSAARFADLRVSCYTNIIDPNRTVQFSATVFSLSPTLHFVAYRGTDNTLVGWREDYNMSFVTPVPAQLESVKYLHDIAWVLDGDFILGGHSKGGNLSIYAAAYAKSEVQERILNIYCHDGPGFDGEVLRHSGYSKIADKIRCFVPQSSVVGMMFEHVEDFTIVSSTARSFWQHDLYTWQVTGADFICLDTVSNSSKFIDKTIKAWLQEVPPQQREAVVEGMFELIRDCNAQTLSELFGNKLETAKAVIKAAGSLDESSRQHMTSSLGTLVKVARENIGEVWRD